MSLSRVLPDAVEAAWLERLCGRRGVTEDDVMIAIASLLDDAHEEKVQALWRELESRFALRIPYGDPLAHISYQVYEEVDVERLKADLREWTSRRETFDVTTSGFGIFPGPRPVLYVPVVRGPRLHDMHLQMASWLSFRGYVSKAVYAPERWIPHITLAIVNGDKPDFQDVIRYLCARPLRWRIEIDNLAVISATRTGTPGLECSIPLERHGPSRNGGARAGL